MTQKLKAVQPEEPTVGPELGPVADAAAWDMYAAQWTRHLRARNLSDYTIRGYLRSYQQLAGWALPRNIDDPEEITRDDLEEFFGWLLTRTTRRGRTASPSAVAKTFRELRVFFNWLADKEDVASIMAKMSAPVVPEKPVDVFTDDELRALVGACRGRGFTERRDSAIVRMLLDTGIRRAELAGLTVDNIDQDRQIATVLGKGRREREVFYGAKTAESLDDYLRSRAKHPDRKRPDLWLATKPHRGALGYDGIGQMLERRGKLAGVDNVHPHRFRHTAADAWFSQGGREGDAMRHFGWRSRNMVDRYGASAADRRAVEAARKLSTGDRI